MPTTDNQLVEAVAQATVAAVHAMLPDIIRDVTTAIMSTAMRPAVIQSDSGVSSVTREYMPSTKGVKITAHIYHENPYIADMICQQVYRKAIEWGSDSNEPYTYTSDELNRTTSGAASVG